MSVNKTLFILRHAKSSWDDFSMSDFDRPLTKRGISDANLLASCLKDELSCIELVVSSSAARAAHTANIFCDTVRIPHDKLVLKKNIYESSVGELMRVVAALPPELHCVMLVGHNPTFTSFVNEFLSQGIANLPTAGLVRLDFDVDSWSNISKKRLRASWFDFPKNH